MWLRRAESHENGATTSRLKGKVERSHRVDEQEFYQLLDKDGIADDIRLFKDKLREWEDYYNYQRPRGSLDGEPPYERLLAKKKVRQGVTEVLGPYKRKLARPEGFEPPTTWFEVLMSQIVELERRVSPIAS